MHLILFEVKLSSLRLKTQFKQLLGSLVVENSGIATFMFSLIYFLLHAVSHIGLFLWHEAPFKVAETDTTTSTLAIPTDQTIFLRSLRVSTEQH